LYCRSGKRSATCLSVLKDAGFQRATHLEGGILAWQSFNQDTEKGING
jgi:sulfur-carrier protein adenylyltransferase/sulfurtransferase